jgi:aldehyde:ferredoxin oxidoreductase
MPVAEPGGYHSRGLWFDRSTARASWRTLSSDLLRGYLGGVGLGTRLLAATAPPTTDPLAAEAALVFAFSPLVGTPLTTSAKLAVVARSPLTGRLCDALSSSHFAIAARRAGLDALVVTGAAPELSVLLVDDDGARLEPCPELAGLTPAETDERLRSRLGTQWRVAAIGIAGENQVRYATISNDGRHAGRGGLGAVMGSKRLKAIAVSGSRTTPLAHPALVVDLARDLSRQSFGPATEKYRELGTVANLLVFNRLAVLPTRNFQAGAFEDAAALSAEELAPARELARESCAACTIGCEHVYAYGKSGGRTRIEYESMFALGSLLGISEADAVLAAAARCDELGLDTISLGGTLAWAIECHERGLLDAGDFGLRFGDADALPSAIDAIAARRGLGDLLAEGSRRAAATLGAEASDLACHVKGLELPGYEPRGLQTMALGLAVGTRGADHNRSGAYEADFSGEVDRICDTPERHAAAAIASEDRAALIDSLILCKFLRGVFDDLHDDTAPLLAAVTGWDVDGAELRTLSRRIVNARKAYNLASGSTRAEDTLPPRFLREPLEMPDGRVAALPAERLNRMIGSYYELRGWYGEGRIPATLEAELGLGDLFEPIPEEE